MFPRPVLALVALAAISWPAAARAGDNDLVLSRLADVVEEDGMPAQAVGANDDFRSLVSELGVVFAPRLVEPADTLGFGGFEFTGDVAFTKIHTDRSYWRALRSSPDPANADTSVIHGDDFMTTVGVFARKGIWLPAPSFEIGVGAVHLIGSTMWAGQMYAKLALIEGYHDLPIPSVALRGGVSRMMGSDQLNLTVASVDLSFSKSVGVAGTFNAAPYAGWNWLVVIPRSEVLDKTPHIDARAEADDVAMNFAFANQDDITRHRLFGGLKLKYHVFALTLEGAVALAGSSVDDRSGTDMDCADAPTPTTDCDSADGSGPQATFTASGGFDF